MKDVRNYLHLYLGCEVLWENPEGTTGGTEILDGHLVESSKYVKTVLKPILRRLSSMTEEEKLHIVVNITYPHVKFSTNESAMGSFDKDRYNKGHNNELYPDEFTYLLRQGFDLFNLIDEGLALDASTLQNKNV